MSSRYISPQEFAELFGITRRTVYKKIKEEKLPYVQIGGKKGPLRIDMYEYTQKNSVAVPGV